MSPEETRKNSPPLPKSTSIENWEVNSENNADLLKNFPNSFNDSTTIQYRLNENTNVKLEVYNVEGKLLSTLVDEPEPAGKHQVIFNGLNLKGGIYYCKLTTDNFTEIGKRF